MSGDEPTENQPGAGAWGEYARRRDRRLRGGGDDPARTPAHEDAWRKGYEGERLVGQRLNEAARAVGGVAVLHDLTLPGKRANIDHVVIGPAGVMIVDAKAWAGRVWIGRETIGQGRYARRRAMEGMRHQVQRVHATLAAAGWDHVPVVAVICLVNGARGATAHRVQSVDGVYVGSLDAVTGCVTQPGPIGLEAVHKVQALLVDRFHVNGGAVTPVKPYAGRLPAVPSKPQPAAGSFGRRRARRSRIRLAPPPPRRRGRRRSRESLSGLLARFAACIAMLVVGVPVVQSMFNRAITAAMPLSRAELDARRPELRALATAAAHGAVRRPRVRMTASEFVLTYRRGRRCVVIVSVSTARTTPAAPPGVTAAHCARRRRR